MAMHRSNSRPIFGPQRFWFYAAAWVIEQILDCLRPPIPFDLVCGPHHGEAPSRDLDDDQEPPSVCQRSLLPVPPSCPPSIPAICGPLADDAVCW